jgi:hypothetical protein
VIVAAIETAIARNADLRAAIRAHALDRFDHDVAIRDYLQIIEEYRAHFGGGQRS